MGYRQWTDRACRRGGASLLVLLIALMARCSFAAAPPATDPVTDPRATVLDAKNFIFAPPPPGWTPVWFKRSIHDACLEFKHTAPGMTFSIIAEVPPIDPEVSTEKLMDLGLRKLATVASSLSILEKTPQQIHGIDGIRVLVKVTVAKQQAFICYWDYAAPGGWYQLVTTGSDEQAVRTESALLNDCFSLKNPALASKAVDTFAPPYQSDLYRYSFDIKTPGWQVLATRTPELSMADYILSHGIHTCAMVVPVWLAGQDPDDDALARALLNRMTFAFDQVSNCKKITEGNATGFTFDFARDMKGNHYHYQAKTLKANGFGYLIAAWSELPDQDALLHQAVDAFGLREASAAAFDPANLSPAAKIVHSHVLNEIGNSCDRQEQYLRAASFHRRALEMSPEGSVFLDNLLGDYIEAKQLADALEWERKYINRVVRPKPSVRARAAMIEAQVGDHDKALELYRPLFSANYEGIDALREYCNLLFEMKREDEAIAVAEHYRSYTDTADAVVVQADLYARKGDFDRAIAELTGRQSKGPFNASIAYTLCRDYLSAKRYAQAQKTAQSLIDAGRTSAYVYLQLGRAQMGLKLFRDAKATFETAAQKDPEDRVVQSWLRHVSGMLGEGENSGIKTPIEPVSIPDSILHPAAPPVDFGKDANACYLNKVTAVSFLPGKEYKTTLFEVIKVASPAGVEDYNALEFSFDPLSEQLYVNRLVVKDSTGQVVGTGSVDSCYTLDRPHEESASFSKLLNVPVPGLKAGCTIELTLTRLDLSEPKEMRFIAHPLSLSLPCANSSLFVRGELSAIRAISPPGFSRQSVDGGWCWTVPNPQIFRFEPMQAEFEDFLPYVFLSDINATWPSEAKKYLDTVTDELKPDPQADALAAELTRGLTSEAEKLDAILRHLQGNYTYKALEFGRRARIPNKPAEVIRNRYGDCKDHALLLHHLLNSAGIHAELALVRTLGPLTQDAPSLDQFNHMIVCVPGSADNVAAAPTARWFDCTDKSSDLTTGIPMGLAERDALLLDPQNPRLVRLPAYPPGSSAVNIKRDATLDDSGDLHVHEIVSSSGYYGSTLRDRVQHTEPKDRVTDIQGVYAGRGLDLVVRDVTFNNLDRPSQPFIMEVTYVLRRRFTPAGTRLVGSLPAPWERYSLACEHLNQRETPFCIRYPVAYHTSTTFSLPRTFGVSDVPSPIHFSDGFSSGSGTITFSGSTVRQEFAADLTAGRFSPGAYEKYEQSRLDLLAALEQSLVLDRK